MNRQLIILLFVLFLISLGSAVKKGRKGWHHASARKEGNGHGYSFFDRNKIDDDDDFIKRNKDNDRRPRSVYKAARMTNIYASKKTEEIA
jgi:hypothetical protein